MYPYNLSHKESLEEGQVLETSQKKHVCSMGINIPTK